RPTCSWTSLPARCCGSWSRRTRCVWCGRRTTMLRLTDLCVSYGGRTALGPLTLELPAGRLVAVTGPSGSGKSSLLLSVAGRVRYDGSVLLDDREIDRADVALVPQGNHLARVLTAVENIVLPLAAAGASDPLTTAEA